MIRLPWLLLVISLVFVPLVFSDEGGIDDSGKAAYARCAACHLADGTGIPGAFPPLRNRVASIAKYPEGREYLVGVITKGLIGQIAVAGVPYFGAMPAQASEYSATGISDLLNFIARRLNDNELPADWAPFTTAEVEGYNRRTKSPSRVKLLREKLGSQYPELF